MKLNIQLFAGLAEALGTGKLELELENEAPQVSDMIEALCQQHTAHAVLIRQCFPAVNQAYATSDTDITESDEIALIPPVSGG
jgi:molybdopterin converting factor subunit 1